MPKVIQVIESEVTRGRGIEGNPYRSVMQYHALDGVLLAERDMAVEDGIAELAKQVDEKVSEHRANGLPEPVITARLVRYALCREESR